LKGKDVCTNNNLLNRHIKNLPKNKYKLDKSPSNLIEFMNGIDLFVLPSLSESFPNVLAESMMCKTPVVSTDVGCARNIIFSTGGLVVPSNDSMALYNAIKKMYNVFKIKKKWNNIQNKSRNRILKKYNIQNINFKYEKLWKI